MKVKDLIKELQKHNPQFEVLTYIEQPEEYGKIERFEIISKQRDMPYGKYEAPRINGKSIVLIRGEAAFRE